MITAVDTNVILDVVIPDEQFGRQSREWLAEAYDVGSVIVCDIMYAELVPVFSNQSTLDGVLRQIGIHGSSINPFSCVRGRIAMVGVPKQRWHANTSCNGLPHRCARYCRGGHVSDARSWILLYLFP